MFCWMKVRKYKLKVTLYVKSKLKMRYLCITSNKLLKTYTIKTKDKWQWFRRTSKKSNIAEAVHENISKRWINVLVFDTQCQNIII